MAKSISAILKLKDEMSRPLFKISSNVGKVTKEMKTSRNQMNKWAKSASKNIDQVIKKTTKLGAGMVVAVGALATKAGFGEAFAMEGYKVQLETAVKDTKKASELMAKAVEFANKTPFETGSVVEATAKMEAYGISSKRWLSDVADMAGATNKSIDQATEAMADAVMGEWERLKEFGIKKDMLVAASSKKYGDQVVFNNKGQVIDQIKMQEILQETMKKKFSGGAKDLSKTSKGMWSTIVGVTKSSLSKIVGMQADGTIKQGSLYEKLQKKMQSVVDTLTKWQKDGTIDKIAKEVTGSVNKMYTVIKKIFDYVIENKKSLKENFMIAGTIYAAVKAVEIFRGVLVAANVVAGILNGTLALNPYVLVGMTIIGIGIAIYKNWEKITEVWSNAMDKLKGYVDKFREFLGLDKSTIFDAEFNRTENNKINKETGKEYGQEPYDPYSIYKNRGGIGIGGAKNSTWSLKNKVDAAKKETLDRSVTVNINGTVYSEKDFNEKVAKAIVVSHQINKSNVVGAM